MQNNQDHSRNLRSSCVLLLWTKYDFVLHISTRRFVIIYDCFVLVFECCGVVARSHLSTSTHHSHTILSHRRAKQFVTSAPIISTLIYELQRKNLAFFAFNCGNFYWTNICALRGYPPFVPRVFCPGQAGIISSWILRIFWISGVGNCSCDRSC